MRAFTSPLNKAKSVFSSFLLSAHVCRICAISVWIFKIDSFMVIVRASIASSLSRLANLTLIASIALRMLSSPIVVVFVENDKKKFDFFFDEGNFKQKFQTKLASSWVNFSRYWYFGTLITLLTQSSSIIISIYRINQKYWSEPHVSTLDSFLLFE